MKTTDKSLRWLTIFRYRIYLNLVTQWLPRLQRAAQQAGCLGVNIQAGIALEVLNHEAAIDEDAWLCRKVRGVYEKRGLPIPTECMVAEALHSARVAGGAR